MLLLDDIVPLLLFVALALAGHWRFVHATRGPGGCYAVRSRRAASPAGLRICRSQTARPWAA